MERRDGDGGMTNRTIREDIIDLWNRAELLLFGKPYRLEMSKYAHSLLLAELKKQLCAMNEYGDLVINGRFMGMKVEVLSSLGGKVVYLWDGGTPKEFGICALAANTAEPVFNFKVPPIEVMSEPKYEMTNEELATAIHNATRNAGFLATLNDFFGVQVAHEHLRNLQAEQLARAQRRTM